MDNNVSQVFVSKTGSREQKGSKKFNKKGERKDKIGWYIFLFFMFIVAYAFFSFVVFK
jgi:hypothetical protein